MQPHHELKRSHAAFVHRLPLCTKLQHSESGVYRSKALALWHWRWSRDGYCGARMNYLGEVTVKCHRTCERRRSALFLSTGTRSGWSGPPAFSWILIVLTKRASASSSLPYRKFPRSSTMGDQAIQCPSSQGFTASSRHGSSKVKTLISRHVREPLGISSSSRAHCRGHVPPRKNSVLHGNAQIIQHYAS